MTAKMWIPLPQLLAIDFVNFLLFLSSNAIAYVVAYCVLEPNVNEPRLMHILLIGAMTGLLCTFVVWNYMTFAFHHFSSSDTDTIAPLDEDSDLIDDGSSESVDGTDGGDENSNHSFVHDEEAHENYVRKYGLPYQTTLSRSAWNSIQDHAAENTSLRDDKDLFMAMRGSEALNPSLASTKARAKYLSKYDFKMRRPYEKLVIVTTFGPSFDFDIRSEDIGIEIWGFASTVSEASARIKHIRQTNPYAAFFPMHVLANSCAIALPIAKDGEIMESGSSNTLYRSKASHLKAVGQECDSIMMHVENATRQTLAVDEAEKRYDAVVKFIKDKSEMSKYERFEARRILDQDMEDISIVAVDDYEAATHCVFAGIAPVLANESIVPTVSRACVKTYIKVNLAADKKRNNQCRVRFIEVLLPSGKKGIVKQVYK